MYNQLFEICYYGNGGFDFYQCYKMPIHIRNFVYKKIADAKTKEKEEMDKVSKKGKTTTSIPKGPTSLGNYKGKT